MCPENDNAIAIKTKREITLEKRIKMLRFRIHMLKDPRCPCDKCRKYFLGLYGIHWEPGIGVINKKETFEDKIGGR